MASTTYTRYTITGATQHTRTGQGRKKSLLPIVTDKIIWNVTEAQKAEFSQMAKRLGISESKLVGMLVSLGKSNFLNQ